MHNISVTAIIDLNDLIEYLQNNSELAHHLHAVQRYREQYGTD